MATLKAKATRHRRRSSSAAEVAGGTTAGFAAIACCAPYGVANLVMLAVYKVPVGLCRKMCRKHRRRRILNSEMRPMRSLSANSSEMAELYSSQEAFQWSDKEVEIITEEEFMDLEEEMWGHFSSTGFWRSASRRQQA